MNELIDILFKAAGGGIFGSLLHLGTGFFESWRKKKDAQVEVMLMNAKVAAAEKEAAWSAFVESQKGSNGTTLDTASMPRWVAGVYALVQAFRDFTRPGLTWALGILVATTLYNPTVAPKEVLDEVVFGFFTALFWWFGSRYQKNSK